MRKLFYIFLFVCGMNSQVWAEEKSDKEFIDALILKAGKGDAESQNILGTFYTLGWADGKQNLFEAAKWFRKSAEQGNSSGQFDLAVAYYYGRGVKQDYAKAATLLKKSSEQGHLTAQCNLATFYMKGHGFSQNNEEAYFWYYLCADKLTKFGSFRDEVISHLTAAQIAEVQKRAREWKPVVTSGQK